MGRIVAHVTVSNPLQREREIEFDALVDTGASLLVLPSAWKERLGRFARTRPARIQTADQRLVDAEICGPIDIHIEGFQPIFSEAILLEMQLVDGIYEPLVGYVVLEQAGIALDLVGNRLLAAGPYDVKSLAGGAHWR